MGPLGSDSSKGEAPFSDMPARDGDGLVAFGAFFVFSNLVSVNGVAEAPDENLAAVGAVGVLVPVAVDVP